MSNLDQTVDRAARAFFAHPVIVEANPHPKAWRLLCEAITRACEEAESHTKASAADAMAAQMELNAKLLQTIAKLETENQQLRQRLKDARACENALREQILRYQEVKGRR